MSKDTYRKYFEKTVILLVSIATTSLYLTDSKDVFWLIALSLFTFIAFSIVGLFLIAISDVSKKLYKSESEKDNSKTHLHELISLFTGGVFAPMLAIILMIIQKCISGYDPILIYNLNISICFIVTILMYNFSIVSLYNAYHLFKMYCYLIIQESRLRNHE